MGKDKKEKLILIKRFSFDLYNRVMFNEISIQDAYNKMNEKLTHKFPVKGMSILFYETYVIILSQPVGTFFYVQKIVQFELITLNIYCTGPHVCKDIN